MDISIEDDPRDPLNRLLRGQLPPYTAKLKPIYKGKNETLFEVKHRIDDMGFDSSGIEKTLRRRDLPCNFDIEGSDLLFKRRGSSFTSRLCLEEIPLVKTMKNNGWQMKLEKPKVFCAHDAYVAVTLKNPQPEKKTAIPTYENVQTLVLHVNVESPAIDALLGIPISETVGCNEHAVGYQMIGLDLSPDGSILVVSWKGQDPDVWNVNRTTENFAFTYFYDVRDLSKPLHRISKTYDEDGGDPTVAFDPRNGHSCFTTTYPKQIETVTVRLPMERYRISYVPVVESCSVNFNNRGIGVSDSVTLMDSTFESLFSKNKKLKYSPDGRFVVYQNLYSARCGFGMYGGKMKMEVIILDAADLNNVIGRHKFQWHPGSNEDGNVDWFTEDNIVYFSKHSEKVLIVENVTKTSSNENDETLHLEYSVMHLPKVISLQDICRKSIRKSLNNDNLIYNLPLPNMLQNFVDYKYSLR